MKEKEDKQLEILIDKVMGRSALENPSFNFTDKVMLQVEKLERSTSTTYQPLISKPVWVLILIGFMAFLTFIVFVLKPESSDWFNIFDLNPISTVRVTNLFKGLQLTKIVAYGLGFLSLMLMVQIPLLKNYFDKRIEF